MNKRNVTDSEGAGPSPSQRPFSSPRERLALGLVLAVLVGLPLFVLGARAWLTDRASPGVRVVNIVARLPAEGGFSPDVIRVQKGERVRLRITSEDVVHGLRIGHLGVDVDWIEPGQVQEVEFVAEEAGTFDFYCTVWCDAGHWRMRGTLEVSDPQNPSAVSPPEVEAVPSDIDPDAPHLAQHAPDGMPSVLRGGQLFASTVPLDLSPSSVLAGLDTRRLSLETLYLKLEGGELPGLAQGVVARWSDGDRWDLVAFLWRSTMDDERLARGAELFRQDCSGCHGESGRGDGPGALLVNEIEGAAGEDQMRESPADFTDASALAGATPWLLYAKIARGGMGSGMPYWGTVYTSGDLWSVVEYLWLFLFDDDL